MMHSNTMLKAIILVVIFGSLPTNLYAQADCNVLPEFDINNDGLNDAFVSPNATIIRTDIDCSRHSIAAGVIFKDSGVSEIVTIETGAKLIRSFVSYQATVGVEARLVDSFLDSLGSSVGAHTVLKNKSLVTDSSTVAEDSTIDNAKIFQSQVGANNVIRDSQINTFNIGNGNHISGESMLTGNSQRRSTLGHGARISGAYIEGPITIGSDARIRSGASILGSKTIGDNFRVGRGTSIGFGGDILGDVTIGERVTIANNPDIGFNNTIGSDVVIGFAVETLNNVIIRPFANIGEETFIDRDVVVGRSAVTGKGVQIAPEAVIKARATIGESAKIGFGAIVRAGANVPAKFIIRDNTIFPDDYDYELAVLPSDHF